MDGNPIRKKMGRPQIEKPKAKVLRTRVTDEEYENVMTYVDEHHMTQSELVLGAIKKCYPECFK
ncbi:hypothetical protein SAMN05443270_3486 [Lacrimispora sphenoides]|uniref:hypothetical protein n=1 Tax=Lacrimispora sphenoides TaxID=29370 RepID=UPI0008CD474D|nr:hypothetical protein [Lacrimispora sphenoides]SEU22457.1 hypothetical protein SAMN05443270_3486 [Lacrimispora sphenoides]